MEQYGSLIRDVSFPISLSHPPSLISSFGPTVTHDGNDVTMDAEDDTREYPCIIRVTDGKDVTLSTHVRTFILMNSSQFRSWTFHRTDNIRRTGQVPQCVRCITQIIDDHTEKTRQKAREGSYGENGRTETTNRRACTHRGTQTGERSKEATEED